MSRGHRVAHRIKVIDYYLSEPLSRLSIRPVSPADSPGSTAVWGKRWTEERAPLGENYP